MKNVLSTILLLTGLYGYSQNEPKPKTMKMPADVVGEIQDTAVYSGTYSGKNLFFQNVFFQNDKSNGYNTCVTEVLVNGKETTDEIKVKAFEIDFAKFKMKQGDKVLVKIIHKKDCTFKCLNEEVLHNGKPSK